jgi:hypothetical protein
VKKIGIVLFYVLLFIISFSIGRWMGGREKVEVITVVSGGYLQVHIDAAEVGDIAILSIKEGRWILRYVYKGEYKGWMLEPNVAFKGSE